jgi:hypothetical protein
MPAWEYKQVSIRTRGGIVRQVSYRLDIEEQCNAAGREGWELVAAVPLTEIRGRTNLVSLIFKRPR